MTQRKTTTILLSFFWIATTVLAQNALSGILKTQDDFPVPQTPITLLKAKDSTNIDYRISNDEGFFSFESLEYGKYIMQIQSLGLKDMYKDIEYVGKPLHFPELILQDDVSDLNEVVISAVIPMTVKKDTLAFSAKAFKVNSGDNIEGLLKKIPDLEIESDGKIIAQGEEVTKIFVDGKEFFGGDPSIVLKNLSADAISKIEVIDRKSDEAELIGVDDGNREIVINLSLKPERKNSGFGKLSGGVGLDNRFFTNANYNRFSPKTQFSVIGKFNNINITGSNIRGFLQNVNGVADNNEGEKDDLSTRRLSGFLETAVSGVHYGHEFRDKESINADYFFNYTENKGISNTDRKTVTARSIFNYLSENDFNNTTKNHNVNLNYKNKANKNSTIIARGKIVFDDRESSLIRDGEFLNEENIIQTRNALTSINHNERKKGDATIKYFKKLSQSGRGFSTSVKLSSDNLKKKNNQDLLTIRRVNTPREFTRNQLTIRDEEITTNRINVNFKYTEHLGGHHFIRGVVDVNSGKSEEDVTQIRETITSESSIDDLIYDYKHRENSYENRLVYKYNTPKINLSSSAGIQSLYRNFGIIDEDILNKNKTYFRPGVFLQYKPSKSEKYRFSYSRIIKNPTSRQSSTVINDLNPFFINRGNPDLRAEKIDKFSALVNINSKESGINFVTRLNYSLKKNAIVSNIQIDEDFVRARGFDNIGERKDLGTFFSLTKKMNDIGLRCSLKNRLNFSSYSSLINLELNDVASKNLRTSFVFENLKKGFFDVKLGASFNYNNTKFSTFKDLNRSFSRKNYFTMFDYDISKKLTVNTQFDYIVFSDSQLDSEQELPLWSAAFSYAFTEKHSNVLKLVLIDLLDENIDIHRRSRNNYVEQTVTESLGRYFILSFTHRINGNKKRKEV